jgi:hypothetical protein
MGSVSRTTPSRRHLSLPLKIAYSVFVVLHIVVNYRYSGPLNFLWFCDIAVLITLAAVLLESALLLSVACVLILLPMSLWIVDLGSRVVMGHGHYLFGIAGYMFDPHIPRDVRIVSSFHVWLPILLLWMLYRLGYDRRALAIVSFAGVMILLVSFLASPRPPRTPAHPEVNVNLVFGFSDQAPQSRMPGWLYLMVLMALYPPVVYLPTHLIVSAIFPRSGDRMPGHWSVSTQPA